MSVIVKGMEMPENCLKCPMQFGGWCYAAPPEIDERVAPTVDEAVEKGKPEWCPLVDLGKHGRLIDADAMCNDLATVNRQFERMVEWCINVTEAQPTIVEAEDEGT